MFSSVRVCDIWRVLESWRGFLACSWLRPQATGKTWKDHAFLKLVPYAHMPFALVLLRRLADRLPSGYAGAVHVLLRRGGKQV